MHLLSNHIIMTTSYFWRQQTVASCWSCTFWLSFLFRVASIKTMWQYFISRMSDNAWESIKTTLNWEFLGSCCLVCFLDSPSHTLQLWDALVPSLVQILVTTLWGVLLQVCVNLWHVLTGARVSKTLNFSLLDSFWAIIRNWFSYYLVLVQPGFMKHHSSIDAVSTWISNMEYSGTVFFLLNLCKYIICRVCHGAFFAWSKVW